MGFRDIYEDNSRVLSVLLSQPDVVGTLIHLKELWVDYNRLMKLPKVRLLKNIAFFLFFFL